MKKTPAWLMSSLFSTRKIIIALLCIISLGSLLSAGYFYFRFQNAQVNEAQREVRSVMSAIGKLAQLPENEVPTVATVSDKQKLSDQPFFQNAENGDKLLVYLTAGKVYLYRPSIKKIIDIAPVRSVNSSDGKVAGVSNETQPSKITVELLNGTNSDSALQVAEAAMKNSNLNYTISSRKNAINRVYKRTQVYDLSKNHLSEAKTLATALNGSVVTGEPNSEELSNADILVVLGESLLPEQPTGNSPLNSDSEIP